MTRIEVHEMIDGKFDGFRQPFRSVKSNITILELIFTAKSDFSILIVLQNNDIKSYRIFTIIHGIRPGVRFTFLTLQAILSLSNSRR